MMNGKILKCCKIPIKTEINTIGSKTLKKKDISPLFNKPPNTKFTPAAAYFNNSLNKFEIAVMRMRPTCVFNSRNVKINCTISMIMIGLNLMYFLFLLAIKARKKRQ